MAPLRVDLHGDPVLIPLGGEQVALAAQRAHRLLLAEVVLREEEGLEGLRRPPGEHRVELCPPRPLRLAHAPCEDERVVDERVLLAARHEDRRELREQVARRLDRGEVVVRREVGVAVRADVQYRHRAHLRWDEEVSTRPASAQTARNATTGQRCGNARTMLGEMIRSEK